MALNTINQIKSNQWFFYRILKLFWLVFFPLILSSRVEMCSSVTPYNLFLIKFPQQNMRFTKSKNFKAVEAILLLPNTDRLQQFEDYVRGCTCTCNRFHETVYDRRNKSLDCFNRETHNYVLWQSVLVKILYKGKTILVFVEWLTWRDNEIYIHSNNCLMTMEVIKINTEW